MNRERIAVWREIPEVALAGTEGMLPVDRVAVGDVK